MDVLKLEGVTAQQLYDESEPLLVARRAAAAHPAQMSVSNQVDSCPVESAWRDAPPGTGKVPRGCWGTVALCHCAQALY